MDYSKYCRAIQKARLSLRRYRQERREMVRQYVGNHWSDEGTAEDVPINLIALYVQLMSRSLVAKNPRVMLSTFRQEHKRTVSVMDSWINKEIESMSLVTTLQRVVIDALFSVGICKVALASPADAAMAAWNQQSGIGFAERVDLDDFVFDVHAKDFKEAGFQGHRFRIPVDVARKVYKNKKIEPSQDKQYNEQGDERIGVMGRGYYSSEEEYDDFCDLWEIYLPRHRQIVTFIDQGESAPDDKPLKVQRWVGPYCGPYHFLCFGVVPGNAMPKAPIQDLMDQHLFINNIYRKLQRQSRRLKMLTLVQGGASEDGDRILNANDGDMPKVDNPDSTREVEAGGPSQKLFAMFADAISRFSWLAGNLDSIGGLGPQSKTATQDKLLSESSSMTVADKQETMLAFASKVIESLCWFGHHNPYLDLKGVHQVAGSQGEFSQQRVASVADRAQVDFEDLEIKVDPYSMTHQTPQTRMQAMQQVVSQIVVPMMQLLVQQGISFDINTYLQKLGRYMDMPDLAEILTIAEPIQPNGGGGSSGPTQPETTRNYVRENVSEQTREGADMQLRNSMMGAETGGQHTTNGAMA